MTRAQGLLRAGRLADPDEHFPYRHAEVRELVAENPPAGPNGPDDARVRVEDFMTGDIADASRDYIGAQEAYLRDPGNATRAEYERCKELLIAARQEHRANRGGVTVVGIRARRAGEA
jgi:hypothetical protein